MMDLDESPVALERAKSGRGSGPARSDAPGAVPVAVAAERRRVGSGAAAAHGWATAKLAMVLALLGTGVYVLLGADNSPFVYSYMVDEVVADPRAHVGRTLRVEGLLETGSIRFREEPCEWRFVLERGGRRMPVEFAQCVVPDTFRDGMGISVVVEGRLREDGSFVASQVIPRCPSRYEMEQRQRAGEAMPHAPPPETSSLPAAPPPT
jgi:cytochrome c-type biogenesis protein CcmE